MCYVLAELTGLLSQDKLSLRIEFVILDSCVDTFIVSEVSNHVKSSTRLIVSAKLLDIFE